MYIQYLPTEWQKHPVKQRLEWVVTSDSGICSLPSAHSGGSPLNAIVQNPHLLLDFFQWRKHCCFCEVCFLAGVACLAEKPSLSDSVIMSSVAENSECCLRSYISSYVLTSNFGYFQWHRSEHSCTYCAALSHSDSCFIDSLPKFIHFKFPDFSLPHRIRQKLRPPPLEIKV